MQWYYALNGQRLGPVSQDELAKMVTEGVIKGDTLVWSQGMTDWVPYAKVASGAVAGAGSTPVDDGTELCAVSGQRYPRSQMINYGGRWISAEHRDTFFQRQREGVAQTLVGDPVMPGPFGYGGFWLRVGATLLDFLIMVILLFAVGMVIGLVMGVSALRDPANVRTMQNIIRVVNLVMGLGYQIFFLHKYDATPGKLALGLKVLRSDGSKLSIGRIIGRYFAHILSGILIGIGYILVAFDAKSAPCTIIFSIPTSFGRAKPAHRR